MYLDIYDCKSPVNLNSNSLVCSIMISRKLNTTIFNNRQLFKGICVTTKSSERLNANILALLTKDEVIMSV